MLPTLLANTWDTTLFMVQIPWWLFGVCCFVTTLAGTTLSFALERNTRLGATRRQAVGQFVGLSVIACAALFARGLVLPWLEQLLCAYVWPALSPGVQILNFSSFLPWWGYAAAYVGSLLSGFMVGAGMQRFGSKFAGWLCCVGLLGGVLLDRLRYRHQALTESLLIYGGIALCAALFIWSIWSYLHAVIKR